MWVSVCGWVGVAVFRITVFPPQPIRCCVPMTTGRTRKVVDGELLADLTAEYTF